MKSRYSILIQWSDEDQCYIVTLPEFGKYARTHGDTYEEAIKNAQEVLELLIEDNNKRLYRTYDVKLTGKSQAKKHLELKLSKFLKP